MSYPIPSKLWQRLSIVMLLLLIPSVGITVFSQSLINTALAKPENSTTIPVKHPHYQALQGLIKNYSCLVPVENFGKRPVNRTQFAQVINACVKQMKGLIATDSSLVSTSDLKTLERLQKEFAKELATIQKPKQEFAIESDIARNRGGTRGASRGASRGARQVPAYTRSLGGIPASKPVPIMAQPLALPNRNYKKVSPPPEPEIRIRFNSENYNRIDDNPFHRVVNKPLSTFSIDVDTASYSNMRRFINQGKLPPKDAVRVEELINYFSYNYPQPRGNKPFSVTTEVDNSPWNTKHKLVQVGLQGKTLESRNLPPSNLVFLIDVSGSMGSPNKLPLVQQSLKLLVNKLRPQDRVSLVVYAGNAGLVLPSTSAQEKSKIVRAIDRLKSGGSTAGGKGIELAYRIAKQNFMESGNNRVILASDGDFNVGVSSDAELTRLIEKNEKREFF